MAVLERGIEDDEAFFINEGCECATCTEARALLARFAELEQRAGEST